MPRQPGINEERAIEAAKREQRAIALKIRGYTYQQISDALGYGSAQNARRAIERAKARIVKEDVKELVEQQWDRLEKLHTTWWDKRETVRGVRVLMSIYERGARLKGLDAPKKLDDETIKGLGEFLGQAFALATGAKPPAPPSEPDVTPTLDEPGGSVAPMEPDQWPPPAPSAEPAPDEIEPDDEPLDDEDDAPSF